MVTHDVDEAVLLSDRIVMMTNGPAATHRRDRSRSTCRGRATASRSPHDPRYIELRATVLEFLYRKQLQQAAEGGMTRQGLP